jgi:hypothetical protein
LQIPEQHWASVVHDPPETPQQEQAEP